MLRRLPSGSLKEQEIAWKCPIDLASYEVGIETPDGSRIGELGEGAGVEVREAECATTDAEDVSADGCVRERVLAYGIDRRDKKQTGRRGPGPIMEPQSFTERVPDERGAIGDFGWPMPQGKEVLFFSQERKPLPKYLPIMFVVQPQKIGRAVRGEIALCQSESELGLSGVKSRQRGDQSKSSWHRTCPDVYLPSRAHLDHLAYNCSLGMIRNGDFREDVGRNTWR